MKSTPQAAALPSPRAALVVAALLILALQRFMPYGRQLLYPFTLLSTWVHEMGHGVTALLLGGRFARLDIFADASGLASTAVIPGWRQGAVSAGGLLAPPLVGMLLLVLGRRLPRGLLVGLALAMMASLVLWIRTPVGWLTVGGLALLCATVGRFAAGGGRLFFIQLLGLLLALDTVTRADYLFMKSAQVGGQIRTSDIAGVASALGGPQLFWGGLIAAVSALLLLVGLWSVLSVPRPKPQTNRDALAAFP